MCSILDLIHIESISVDLDDGSKVYGNSDKRSNLELVPRFKQAVSELHNLASGDVLLSVLHAQSIFLANL